MPNLLVRLATGGFLIFACITQAHAGATGNYIGLSGGASFLKDERFVVEFQDGNGDGTFGIGAQPDPANFAADYDLGYFGGLTLGVVAESGLRGELEVRYSENDVDSIRINGGSQGSDGTVSSIALMGNGYYDFNRTGRLHPYVGAGFGAAFVDVTDIQYPDDGGDNEIKGDDRVLAYQGMLGVAYDLTERLTVDLGYRYFDAIDPAFTDDEVQVDFGYTQQLASLSLRYVFNATGRIDSDGDGVFDASDQCPDTPAGVAVDSRGCPVDSDNDGVADFEDDCPGTAEGVEVNDMGCPLDSDGDGVPDSLDKCPNTPQGTEVDDKGCKLVVDADGDGVRNENDDCPGTPAGEPVLANGCAARQKFVLKGVKYEFDSAQLTPQAMGILDETAQTLKDSPGFPVELQGHTDSKGTDTYNLDLSQARAESAREYLINQGVSADRIQAKGYGESQPIAPNTNNDGSDNPEGRAKNRRTEIKVLEE